jgi:enterochelin esterase-like enzyme
VTHLLRAGERRAIRIHLPPGYEQADREYPVLYMFDGQNLFDRTTTAFGMEWGIDETIQGLVDAARFPGVVVVGIDSPVGPFQRYAEYTAWDWMLGGEPVVAEGAVTADFLVEQVIPHVQATYRVARDRARVGLAGSSMGGYMTLFTGVRHPEVFGRLLAFSPIVLDEPMAGHELRDTVGSIRRPGSTWTWVTPRSCPTSITRTGWWRTWPRRRPRWRDRYDPQRGL